LGARPSTYPKQRRVLEFFIGAAAEQNKFVNLHTKAGEVEISSSCGNTR